MELILVLVLLATLTSLAAPALSRFAQHAALKDTAKSLLSLVQQAHTRAVYEATKQRVVIDLQTREAWLEDASTEKVEQTDEHSEDGITDPVTWDKSIDIVTDIEPTGAELYVIECQPTGLNTPGVIVLQQEDRFAVLVCDSATERYRLMSVSKFNNRSAEEVLDAVRP